MNIADKNSFVSSRVGGGWLTVNRACNMRCEWCYAAGTEFDTSKNMDYGMATQLVDLLADLRAILVILIGGEPTLYPRLFDLGRYISSKGLTSAIVSNGIRFASKSYCQKLKDSGITNITVSMKGSDNSQYRQLTGTAAFEKVVQGIQNLRDIDIEPSVELTLVKDYIPNIESMLADFKRIGVKHLSIDLATPVVSEDVVDVPNVPDPHELRDAIHRIYRSGAADGIDYVIYMTIPFCLLDPDVLQGLKDEDRLMSSCHVPHGSAIVFDELGKVLPCNHMSAQTIGQWGEDFTDSEEFLDFWNSRDLQEFRKECSCFPAEPCQTCSYWGECGGGCLIKWLHWNPGDFIPVR